MTNLDQSSGVGLQRGQLVKQKDTEKYCIIVSVDPPTRCCGWEPCFCSHKKRYTPMAKVIWQTGTKAGQESAIMVRLLENVT